MTGPDAYRDLPRLLGLVGTAGVGDSAGAVNIQASFVRGGRVRVCPARSEFLFAFSDIYICYCFLLCALARARPLDRVV